jgi:hypothetical protein
MSEEPAYYANGATIHKAPVRTRNQNGSTNISLGFPVCELTDWVGEEQAETVAELLCRGERYDELVKALTGLLERYTSLVNCGDCGNWDPETEDDVIAARAALMSVSHSTEGERK